MYYNMARPWVNRSTLIITDSSPAQQFQEPITIQEVKAYLNLPERSPVDFREDFMLQNFISGARNIAEMCQGRDLVVKQWDLHMDYWPDDYWIELREPLRSVDLVQYRDYLGNYITQTTDTDYIVNLPRNVITPGLNRYWYYFSPWITSAILIRFTSGFAMDHPFWNDNGARIKHGMLSLISDWYNNRLPFEPTRAIIEYPYAVTACFEYGAKSKVR